ncbi:MAG: alpha/beta hydrolase [Candidatus Roizmanbacteria bacterium]|nr:MAG: alpha/beta hydrolase [Candidatus Roizmanbacteria bacterium]
MRYNPKDLIRTERYQSEGFDLFKFTPETPSSNTPVVLAPGFNAGHESYGLLIQELCKNGFTVICTEYRPEAQIQPQKLGFIPDVDRVKRHAIKSAINLGTLAGGKVHFVGHSKAAIEGIPIIKKNPDKIEGCILIAPRGILKKKNPVGALGTLIAGEVRNSLGKRRLKKRFPELKDTLKLIKKAEKQYGKFGPKYLIEILSTVTQTIQDSFRQLQEYGVRVVVMPQQNDGYYPPEQMRKILKEVDFPEEDLLILSGIYGALHGAVKYDPTVCQDIVEALKEIEENKHHSHFLE